MLPILIAALLGCGDVCGPEAIGRYAELLAAGGYGRLPFERGAFLIRERDGSVGLEPWTNSGFQRAVYRGTIPEEAIAIVHTHPLNMPNPSAGDRAEAERIGLPVVVVTPDSVIAAFTDGQVARLTTSRQWWVRARADASEAPAPASPRATRP